MESPGEGIDAIYTHIASLEGLCILLLNDRLPAVLAFNPDSIEDLRRTAKDMKVDRELRPRIPSI